MFVCEWLAGAPGRLYLPAFPFILVHFRFVRSLFAYVFFSFVLLFLFHFLSFVLISVFVLIALLFFDFLHHFVICYVLWFLFEQKRSEGGVLPCLVPK